MSKQGSRELDRLIQKQLVKEQIKAQAKSLIVSPDAAKANQQAMYEGQFKPLWTLREQLVGAALSGGAKPDAETVDACDTVAMALMKLRCEECLKLATVTGTTVEHAFLFAAEAFGVSQDILDAANAAANPEPPKLVASH